MTSKRKCTLCPSHKYEYCTKCKDKHQIEPWRLLFDTETCRDVYNILAEFAFGRKSAIEARKELDQYEIPNKEDMVSSLRKNLEDIYELTKDMNYSEGKLENEVNKNNQDIDTSNVEVKPRQRRYTRRKYSE